MSEALRSPAAGFHPANLLTYVALTSGLAAIAAALQGHRAAAGACLAMAALADTFDGRFARRFTRTPAMRAFGGELDSLSDAVAFGVAPVAVVTLALGGGSGGIRPIWWAAAGAYVLCALTRLAHYNVVQNVGSAGGGFIGLPAPAAALVWSTLLVFDPGSLAAALTAILLAAAMVAPFGLRRPGRSGLTAFAAWPLALIVVHAISG
jgi:CDP-diacylglycerol--serine O-phosphatidyltransferase